MLALFPQHLSNKIEDGELLRQVMAEIRLCSGGVPDARKVALLLFEMRARPKLPVLRVFGYLLAKVRSHMRVRVSVGQGSHTRVRFRVRVPVGQGSFAHASAIPPFRR